MKPFLKWAGGKTQLLTQLEHFFPQELNNGTIKRYVEPFIGGGAVFFHIARHYQVEEFYIADINPELAIAYRTIQEDVESLIHNLFQIERKFKLLNEEERKVYYYKIRSQFNSTISHWDSQVYHQAWSERTAQTIFLNRTCFNGLFRVNSKGEFNVPMGRYKNPTICDEDNLRAIAKILKRTKIDCGDFTQCEALVDHSTFVYFDPPYRPLSKTANFTSYSKNSFEDKEQLRLRDFFTLLHQKGAKLMLSNSYVQDDFLPREYQDYQIERVKASRSINSKGGKRGKIDELLIMNYTVRRQGASVF